MLSVKVIAVGKCKERYYLDAVQEFSKRLQAFCKFEIAEIAEAPLPANPSAAEISAALTREGTQILSKIPSRAAIAALCIEGQQMDSVAFSDYLGTIGMNASQLVFLIGSSHGLAQEVKNAASLKLSMSGMTFPHQLARVMLCEQVYRGFCMLSGHKYHK